MITLVIIGAAALLPVILAAILRVHALYVFAAVCCGYFLQFALADDVDLALAAIIKGSNTIMIVRLVLFFVPLIMTLFILRKSAGKGGILQFPVLVVTGAFIGITTLPLLPYDTQAGIYGSAYGGMIKGSQDLVIAAAAVSNLVMSWLLFKPHHEKSKHH